MISFINIASIIIAPIVAVMVGQYLQNKAQRRNDKLSIFKVLMRDRMHGWTVDSVNALNMIDIVFAEDRSVREAWKTLFDALSVGPNQEPDAERINQAKYKLLEEISDSLGYTNTITWESVQNPYLPKGMAEMINNRDLYQRMQMEAMGEVIHLTNKTPSSYVEK